MCNNSSKDRRYNHSYYFVASNFNKKRDDRMKQIKIEGVVAGVCLAAIFLVLLIVMYIYYKSKPTDNVPEESTGKASRGEQLSYLNIVFASYVRTTI